MPELSTPAVETTVAAPAAAPKAAAKKTAKKAAAKKPAAAAKKATKKAAPKKTAKKAAVKKAPGERKERGPSKTQLQILKLLNKKGEMTRTQLSEALDNAFVGSDMMGHLDKNQVKPNSLLGRKLVTVASYPAKDENGKATGAEGPAHYEITAAGKKLVEAAK